MCRLCQLCHFEGRAKNSSGLSWQTISFRCMVNRLIFNAELPGFYARIRRLGEFYVKRILIEYGGRWTDRQTRRQTDRQTERQIDRPTGRQTDRQTDRQIDR